MRLINNKLKAITTQLSVHIHPQIIDHLIDLRRKDLDTLFIVARCAGAGNSTMIQTSHHFDIPLFGDDFHQKLRKTCTTPNFKEYKNYEKAIKQGSIFQARHLIKLEREPSQLESLLLHIDLTGVIKGLGHAATTTINKERIERKTNIPMLHSNMIIPEICDLMITSYVGNPFFKRFKTF